METKQWKIEIEGSADGGYLTLMTKGPTMHICISLTHEELSKLAFEASSAEEHARRSADERLNKEIEELDNKYNDELVQRSRQ